jgi:hypothetical protein
VTGGSAELWHEFQKTFQGVAGVAELPEAALFEVVELTAHLGIQHQEVIMAGILDDLPIYIGHISFLE